MLYCRAQTNFFIQCSVGTGTGAHWCKLKEMYIIFWFRESEHFFVVFLFFVRTPFVVEKVVLEQQKGRFGYHWRNLKEIHHGIGQFTNRSII